MKKWIKLLMMLALMCLCISACGKSQPTWQEQYDLGMRYLEEGDYEQAIVAFTAAIEIDPNQALAYVGRADSYIAADNKEDHLVLAQTDYEKAIELDGTDVTVYTRLVDAYLQTEDYEKAEDVIRRGREKLGDKDELSQSEQKVMDAQPLNLSDTTIKKLERLTMFLFYDNIGDGSAQTLSELTLDEQAAIGMLYLCNIYNEQTDPDSPAQPDIFELCTDTVALEYEEAQSASKENINEFFMDCFGSDFSGYEYKDDMSTLLAERDGKVFTYGGDWGMSWPFAKVMDYAKENGQILVKGVAGYFLEDMDSFDMVKTETASFEIILTQSDSRYLDGYTMKSFKFDSYEEMASTEEPEQSGGSRAGYAAFLQQVHDNPSEYVEDSMGIEEDQFAIADIDQDGKEELVIRFTNTHYGLNMYTGIWELNDAGTVEPQQNVNESCDFYRNGMMVEYASHNHTYGFTVWPSEIYQFDAATGQYQPFASISSADAEMDTEGIQYSAEKDTDGDGILYFFVMEGQAEIPLTEVEYRNYCDQYIPESEKIELDWKNLSQANIDVLR